MYVKYNRQLGIMCGRKVDIVRTKPAACSQQPVANVKTTFVSKLRAAGYWLQACVREGEDTSRIVSPECYSVCGKERDECDVVFGIGLCGRVVREYCVDEVLIIFRRWN